MTDLDKKFVNRFYSPQFDSKYEEENYDLIFYCFDDKKNDTERLFVRIPGSFSHIVFHSLITGRIDFSKHFYSMSRIDFKVDIPTFVFRNFDLESRLLEDFYLIQKKHPTKKLSIESRPEVFFVKGTMNKRESRRFVRTYVSDYKKIKTFELEIKKQGVKLYSEFLEHRDIYNFNKTLILEFGDTFSSIERCLYTDPLLDWAEDFLEVIYNKEFPGATLLKPRGRKPDVICQADKLRLKQLVNSKFFTLNTRLISKSGLKDNPNCLRFMVLVYLSQLLVQECKKQHKDLADLNTLIHPDYWDDVGVRQEKFLENSEYKVTFILKDLLAFLNFTNTTHNRKKVISIITDLMNMKRHIQVGDNQYWHQLVYSFSLINVNREGTTGSLFLHPIVLYDLLAYGAFFRVSFLEGFYSLLKKHQINNDIRTYSFGFYGFFSVFSVFLAFTYRNQEFLMDFLKKRTKTNLKGLKKQLEFINDFLKLSTEHLKIDLGVRLDNETFFPASPDVLEDILYKKHDKILNRVEFFFQPRKAFPIIYEKPENSLDFLQESYENSE